MTDHTTDDFRAEEARTDDARADDVGAAPPTSATARKASRAAVPLEPLDPHAALMALRQRLGAVLLGKADRIELVLACLLARGHLLLDDLPGLGKTTLAKALAISIGGAFARVQCTPDLLPTDITGFSLYNQKSREFEFHSGPVFSDVLLADEVNRTTPRTQSALFEAMAERQVTIDGVTRPLAASFFVIATQNPIESHGAYPLPEAQLDRFAMRLAIGYPDRAAQMAMLEQASGDQARGPMVVDPLLTPGQLERLQEHTATIQVHAAVRGYLVDLVEATRQHAAISLGVSPRGMLLWQRIAQAWAVLHRRDFVTPDDVQAVAEPVLSVRLGVRGQSVSQAIGSLLDTVPVPAYR